MTCRICTTVPESDWMNVIAYMSATQEHLELRLRQALNTLKYHFKDAGRFIMVDVPNLELLVSELDEGEFFTDLETSEVLLLPTDAGQFFDFGLFSQTHPLTYWRALYDNKELLEILKHQRIATLFQPIVATNTLERYGYEALSRGIRLDGRYLSAYDLFEGASNLNLTSNLDKQCRESALRHAAKQKIQNHLFINFMPTAICEPSICLEATTENVAQYTFNPEHIVFESVHTDSLDSYSHLNELFDFFKQSGYKTALDDVGSGYTALEVYHKLDANYIKIDMNIVRNIHHQPEHQALLERLITLKQQYGICLIAKGVEREEEYTYLKSKGIDFMQGYYFGKPDLNIL